MVWVSDKRHTTASNPYGFAALNAFHCASASFRSSSRYSSATPACLAMSILKPLLEARTTLDAPLILQICDSIKPRVRNKSVVSMQNCVQDNRRTTWACTDNKNLGSNFEFKFVYSVDCT